MQSRVAFKVGLVSFLMLVGIATLITWKSGLFLKASGYPLIGEFENIGGLLPGAEVRFRGYRVGKVFKIDPRHDKVLVYFWVQNGVPIRKGSVLRVVFDGLVGEKFLAIRTNETPTDSLKPGDTMAGYSSAGLADFVEIGSKNLEHSEAILRKFKDILTNDDTAASIVNTIKSVELLSAQLASITNQLNSQKTFGQIGDILKNIRQLTASLQATAGDVSNPETAADIKKTIRNLAIFSEQLKQLVSEDGQGDDSTERSGGVVRALKTVTQVRVRPEMGVEYATGTQKTSYQGRVDWVSPKRQFLRTGFGNRSGEAALTELQVGTPLTSKVTGRAGFFYNHPGIGLDYKLTPAAVLSADFYQLDQVQVELTGRMTVFPKLDAVLSLRKDPYSLQQLSNVGLGVRVQL